MASLAVHRWHWFYVSQLAQAYCAGQVAPPPPTPLAAPAGFTAVAGDGQVALSWAASSGAAYRVLRAGVSGGPYCVRLTILGAVPGARYHDTCIAEIAPVLGCP